MLVTVEAWDEKQGLVVLKTRGGVATRRLREAIEHGWVVDLDVSRDRNEDPGFDG